MKRVFIIAEAGVNHNGSLGTAKKMIRAARLAGADAVKFQTFKAESLVSKYAPKAGYQKRLTDRRESQFDMIKLLELSARDHIELISCCKKNGIMFISTPFDLGSIDLLVELGVKTFKIPSGEVTDLPYLRKIGRLRKKILLSTGMSDISEVKRAVRVLVGAGTRKKDLTVMQCNSEYPTPYRDANLRAMSMMRSVLGVEIGYSDHTPGIEVPLAAVGLGASVIEKHFTLDRDMEGPDHKASLEPDELKSMVEGIRHVEMALGDGRKRPSASELSNMRIMRKSVVAAVDIDEGDPFTEKNITVKRPGTGISPFKWDYLLGKKAKMRFRKDQLIIV